MKNIFLLLCVLLLIAITSHSQNNEISAKSTITDVVIYNSSAEVYHTSKLDIPAGKSTIIFSDLTRHVVENTINLVCLAEGVDIITVTEKINYTVERKENDHNVIKLKDSIELITKDLGLISCKIEALDAEKLLLFKGESIGGVSHGVPVDEIEKASLFFRNRYLNIIIETHELVIKKEALEKTRKTLLNQMDQKAVNKIDPISEIHVTVFSSKVQKVSFEFKYLTNKAGWAAAYDFKFKGENQPLDFVFRANVYNATGVNWDNIKVVLSTANPTFDFRVPSVSQNKKATTNKQEYYKDGIKHVELAVMNSIEEYSVSHNYSIPSDGKPYLIDVKNLEMSSEFYYLLIPRIDPFGFLMAKIPNWTSYNLIPGTANIYNKGSFMGRTFLDTYAENDTLNIFLGKSNSIRATRTEEAAKARNTFIGNHFVDKSEIIITATNNQPNPVSISIVDLVPYFENTSNAKFSLNNPNNGTYRENEGTIVWNIVLEKQETKTINFGHEIRIPKTEAQRYKQVNARYRTISCPSF